ncbi:P-type conjugative transfer protein TrbJ [Paremcibacter congregatus]|uniref:P-type conjugative transfer protein TrbJ n=1 Tax=Paremcibacter congregatus TaxID=2043170 RepID=UPI0030EEB38E|tara:strand:- start:583 stop:1281 length:699 start_codon:yes stop_codon:yes gene_type:complete
MKRTSFAALVAVSLLASTPAHAGWPVFDVSNFIQNRLTAFRTLEQINNQIRQLQNQTTMLQNMARNLKRLDYSSLSQIQGALNRIDGLMMQAEGLSFDITQLDSQWRQHYPESYEATVTASEMATAAGERWRLAMKAYHQTMRVQAQIVENVRGDQELLTNLVSQSQSASGSLQAQQAANQLITLSTKQQIQIQTLMAAHYRAEAEEMAHRALGQEAARAITKQFLGSGKAY